MSIVERALQKAQAKARAEGAPADPAPVGESGPEPVPQAATRPGDDDAPGAASLDVKANVSLDLERLRAAGQLPSADVAARTEDDSRQ